MKGKKPTHAIYQADNKCLSQLKASSVHLVVTSPPYVTTEFFEGQEFDYNGFLANFKDTCEELYRVLVPGGRFALNIADIITKYRYKDEKTISRVPVGLDAFQVAQEVGFRLLERYIWDKGYTRNFGGPLLGSYPYPYTVFNNNYFEYIFVLRKPGKRHVKQDIRLQSKLLPEEWKEWSQKWWRIESITEKFDYHRAIFPVGIPYRLIRMYSYKGDMVLDPYIGTGATMIAAHLAGRKSVGFEIEDCEELINHRIKFESKALKENLSINYNYSRQYSNA